jgi:methionyl-tRNA formyltransferase
MQSSKLNVVYLGGKQAGVIGLLTTLAYGCNVKAVVTISKMVEELALRFNLPVYKSCKLDEVKGIIKQTDLMISVHSREIIPNDILALSRLGGINVHPCLKEYKGKSPIQRFLAGDSKQASVGVHKITDELDMGETLAEKFIDIDRTKVKTVDEVYNIIYPLYSLVLIDTLRMISK